MIKKYLLKTLFPKLDGGYSSDSTPPDCAESSCSESSDNDGEEQFDLDSVMKQHEKYLRKEDEDVAVFMALAKQMSVKSLLFLLQNHARAMNIPEACLQQALTAPENATPKSPAKQVSSENKPLKKIKKFRFAEIRGGNQVRAQVHEIPKNEDKTLWWNEEEMRVTRSEAIRTVKYFKKCRPDFATSITMLADSYQESSSDFVVEEYMKELSHDSFARGLESHIVAAISRLRRDTVKAVMHEQAKFRLAKGSDDDDSCCYESSCEALRNRSLAVSIASRTLAAKMGECDHIEALKASLSNWKVQ